MNLQMQEKKEAKMSGQVFLLERNLALDLIKLFPHFYCISFIKVLYTLLLGI